MLVWACWSCSRPIIHGDDFPPQQQPPQNSDVKAAPRSVRQLPPVQIDKEVAERHCVNYAEFDEIHQDCKDDAREIIGEGKAVCRSLSADNLHNLTKKLKNVQSKLNTVLGGALADALGSIRSKDTGEAVIKCDENSSTPDDEQSTTCTASDETEKKGPFSGFVGRMGGVFKSAMKDLGDHFDKAATREQQARKDQNNLLIEINKTKTSCLMNTLVDARISAFNGCRTILLDIRNDVMKDNGLVDCETSKAICEQKKETHTWNEKGNICLEKSSSDSEDDGEAGD